MRRLAALGIAVAIATVLFFVVGAPVGAQNVKAFKSGGGPTGFKSALPRFVPTPGPTTY